MPSTPPNILWILSDQHHAGCLGHGERPEVRTPNLDALAQRGVRFSRAYCNSPICGPSRCSMITGQYPHTTGITGNHLHHLPLPTPETLPVVLRSLGYETMLIGKAHMVRAWNDAGFERLHYCDLCDSDDGDPRNVGYYQHLIDHGLHDSYDLGSRRPGQPGHGLEGWVSELPEAHSVEAWTGDTALSALRDRDPDRPFMMQLSFQRPHEPLCIPPERAEDYNPAALPLPDSATEFFDYPPGHRWPTKPAFQRDYVNANQHGYPYRPKDHDDLRRQLARYYTLVTMIDHQIGRVLDHLEAAGRLQNTVVLYTADHGDFAGDHGLHLKNLGIYESIHRVPMILSYPGGPHGEQRDGLVELVDVYPTLLDAAGLAEHTPDAVEGASMLPVARGEHPGKPHVVCEYDWNQHHRIGIGVRDARYRLNLYATQPGVGELYDHDADPGETHNRYDDPTLRDERLRLTELALNHTAQYTRRVAFWDDRPPDPVTPAYRVQVHGETLDTTLSSSNALHHPAQARVSSTPTART